MLRRSWTSAVFLAAAFCLNSAPAHAEEGTCQTFSGIAGYGLFGPGDAPPYQYYLDLDVPYTVDGQEWQTLLTDSPLPPGQHVTVCGRVEMREFNGLESRYFYPLLTDVHAVDDTQYQTLSGVAGEGLVGPGDAPPHQHYLILDTPCTVNGEEWQMLLTDYPLPAGEHVTLCGHVELRPFIGTETHYFYALLTDVQNLGACPSAPLGDEMESSSAFK